MNLTFHYDPKQEPSILTQERAETINHRVDDNGVHTWIAQIAGTVRTSDYETLGVVVNLGFFTSENEANARRAQFANGKVTDYDIVLNWGKRYGRLDLRSINLVPPVE